jgi:hypothetical protein
MWYQKILMALKAVQRTPKKWVCHCPNKAEHANGDRRASGVIYYNEDKHCLIYKCRACGATGKDIAPIIGIPLQCWFRDGKMRGVDKLEVYEHYIYKTPRGNNVLRVVRGLTRKTFWQQIAIYDGGLNFQGWADGTAVGKYKKEGQFVLVDDTEPSEYFSACYGRQEKPQDYLYRCEDWHDKEGPIFVVEGERKVNDMYSCGFLATCNSMGARNFTQRQAKMFTGRDIFIIPDNDDAGLEHAAKVAGLCMLANSRSVAIIKPDIIYGCLAPAKVDVSDIYNQVGAELREHVLRAVYCSQLKDYYRITQGEVHVKGLGFTKGEDHL